jgi:hypothetical protein
MMEGEARGRRGEEESPTLNLFLDPSLIVTNIDMSFMKWDETLTLSTRFHCIVS